MTAEKLTEAYLAHLLDHGKPPASVYKFCQELKIPEKDFYSKYPSFKALEGHIWKALFSDTHAVLEKDKDYAGYPVRQKLAAFYYTFFEAALNRRSFIELRFAGFPGGLACPSLKKFQDAFEEYAQGLIKEGQESGEIAERGKLADLYPGGIFAQWVFIVDFWLKDESEQFSRTDALIEKSVALGFDAIGTQVVDSAFDFVRFLAGKNVTA
ncbi:MAG: TetR family transcriptional regulator C-terminal domain-containing protein [Verrucomicrobiota bacterium]